MTMSFATLTPRSSDHTLARPCTSTFRARQAAARVLTGPGAVRTSPRRDRTFGGSQSVTVRNGRAIAAACDEPSDAADPAEADADPSAVAHEVATVLSGNAGTACLVQAHTVTSALTCRDEVIGLRADHTRTWSVVVDAVRDRHVVADVDLAWSGPARDVSDVLAGKLERALRRVGLPAVAPPERAQLWLTAEATGALIHEACGHLLEDLPERAAPVRTGTELAFTDVSIADDPACHDGYGAHALTTLGRPAVGTPLITRGRVSGLLSTTTSGPWRSDGTGAPRPRMTWLRMAPIGDPDSLDRALGAVVAPVVRVRRFGAGRLEHRTGRLTIAVKDATMEHPGGQCRLAPFAVQADARALLAGIRAVGTTTATWSAYCHGASGTLPVGAEAPEVLTGPIRLVTGSGR